MQIRVCMYHGTSEERAQLRRTVMALPNKHEKLPFKKPPPTKKRRRHDATAALIRTKEANLITQLTPSPVVISTYEMTIKDQTEFISPRMPGVKWTRFSCKKSKSTLARGECS